VHTSVTDSGCTVSNEQPIALNPPLRGGPWVALYDPMMIGGHRTSIYTLEGRARIPARFAIDWVKLAEDATYARGDATSIANWHGYGAEVLAVADAIVAESVDDMTEKQSLSASEGPLALETPAATTSRSTWVTAATRSMNTSSTEASPSSAAIA
jgi:murein DD-endopeptidase